MCIRTTGANYDKLGNDDISGVSCPTKLLSLADFLVVKLTLSVGRVAKGNTAGVEDEGVFAFFAAGGAAAAVVSAAALRVRRARRCQLCC